MLLHRVRRGGAGSSRRAGSSLDEIVGLHQLADQILEGRRIVRPADTTSGGILPSDAIAGRGVHRDRTETSS